MLPGFSCYNCEKPEFPLEPCDGIDECGNMACSKEECKLIKVDCFHFCRFCDADYCGRCDQFKQIIGVCVKCKQRVCADCVELYIGMFVVCDYHGITEEDGELVVWDYAEVE